MPVPAIQTDQRARAVASPAMPGEGMTTIAAKTTFPTTRTSSKGSSAMAAPGPGTPATQTAQASTWKATAAASST